MITIRLLRPSTGDYGTLTRGSIVSVPDDQAISLESRGLAERYYPPEPVASELPESKRMLAAEKEAEPQDKQPPPPPPRDSNLATDLSQRTPKPKARPKKRKR